MRRLRKPGQSRKDYLREAYPEGCRICGRPLEHIGDRLCDPCYRRQRRRDSGAQPINERYDECPGWPDPCGNRKIVTNLYCGVCRDRAGIPSMDFVMMDAHRSRNLSPERQDAWAAAAIIMVAEVLDTDRLTLKQYGEARDKLETEENPDPFDSCLPTVPQLSAWGWGRLAKLAGIKTGANYDTTKVIRRPPDTWNPAKCREALRTVVDQKGGYVARKEYNRLRGPGTPTANTVADLAGDGSWTEAMRSLQLSGVFTPRSPESMLEVGCAWLKLHGRQASSSEWFLATSHYPTYETVRRAWKDKGGWVGFWDDVRASG